ncbi:MAG: GNAT family N-acetyltransferase [Thermoproteota archaeon]
MDVKVRPMREDDLEEADRIVRLAFGTFLGMPDPMQFMGDADHVRTRYKADPQSALIAEVDGKIVGSNFALDWGSVGIFGPLTVHPDYWDKGVARALLDRTMKIFEGWGTKHVGLFTFAQSSKHVHLYQKYGFWPRYLTAIMSKEVGKAENAGLEAINYSELGADKQKEMIHECARLTGSIMEGLDLKKEIISVQKQKLGDTILLIVGDMISAMAICHCGPGTEAGSGTCYIKFAAVRASADSARVFDSLLDSCERYARLEKATRLVGGVNTGRHNAYRRMIERGFRTDMQGIAMHRPNEPGYNREDMFLIDDWR